jgi:hypothetical protein
LIGGIAVSVAKLASTEWHHIALGKQQVNSNGRLLT